MGKITVELIRKRAEHNEGEIQSLEEISLHQEKIEKIELLDRICKNLKILLLQNNSVSKIENVSRLKSLEYLNLALNMVDRIENLEGCEALKKLDLTLNFIGEISSVQSLRPNYYLEQLYLVGNPCHEFPGYRPYVIAVLPQLKQLDGVEITKSERILAKQKFDEIESMVLLHEEAYLREQELAKEKGSKDKKSSKKGGHKKDSSSPKIEEVDEDYRAFWSEVTPNTQEARLAMNRQLEKQEEEKSGKKPKAAPKPKKLIRDDGRPLNINEPKLSFCLQDEVERNQIILDLAVPKFLCTSLIDADVQTTYVKVMVKGKVFQLVLPEEVRPDSSYAQRSQTTGHLIITMPKVVESSTLVWRGGSGPLIDLTKETKKGDKKVKKSTSADYKPTSCLPPKLGGTKKMTTGGADGSRQSSPMPSQRTRTANNNPYADIPPLI